VLNADTHAAIGNATHSQKPNNRETSLQGIDVQYFSATQSLGDARLQDLLFSIVIACYNQQEFVGESVQSALSQGHQSKEVIVVDDASQDGTAEILRAFGKSIVFAKLDNNHGACAARNYGAYLARGQYLVFLDGDDVLMPWALDTYSRLISAGAPAIILGRAAMCHKEVPRLREQDLPREIRFVEYPRFLAKDRPWVYNTSTLIVERAAFCATDGWSPEIFYQDIQDFLNKLGITGKTTLLLTPDTVWYRFHTMNASYKVPAFIDGIYLLLVKAKAGLYPGGRKHWLERSAWFGGLIFYWVKKAFRCRLYSLGFRLLITKAWLIMLASIRRGMAWLIGRRPVHILPIGTGLPQQ
jgi:glycosyltransferase involved in cell wall biosynthesis